MGRPTATTRVSGPSWPGWVCDSADIILNGLWHPIDSDGVVDESAREGGMEGGARTETSW